MCINVSTNSECQTLLASQDVQTRHVHLPTSLSVLQQLLIPSDIDDLFSALISALCKVYQEDCAESSIKPRNLRGLISALCKVYH